MASWKLTYGGQEWTEDDVTVADMLIVGELLDRDRWADLEPTASPRACLAWLAALTARTLNVDVLVTQAQIAALPLATLVDALTVTE